MTSYCVQKITLFYEVYLQIGDAPPLLVVRHEVPPHRQGAPVDDGDGAVHGAGGDRPVRQEGDPVDGRAVVEEHV